MIVTESLNYLQIAMAIFAHYDKKGPEVQGQDIAFAWNRWIFCQVRGQDGWYIVNWENPLDVPNYYHYHLMDCKRILLEEMSHKQLAQ